MPLYFERECVLGHQLYGDDPNWCPACCAEVIPFRVPFTDDVVLVSQMVLATPEDVMNDALQLDGRLKDLMYGFNDDSIYGINGESGHDNNMSAAEDAFSGPMNIVVEETSMHPR